MRLDLCDINVLMYMASREAMLFEKDKWLHYKHTRRLREQGLIECWDKWAYGRNNVKCVITEEGRHALRMWVKSLLAKALWRTVHPKSSTVRLSYRDTLTLLKILMQYMPVDTDDAHWLPYKYVEYWLPKIGLVLQERRDRLMTELSELLGVKSNNIENGYVIVSRRDIIEDSSKVFLNTVNNCEIDVTWVFNVDVVEGEA